MEHTTGIHTACNAEFHIVCLGPEIIDYPEVCPNCGEIVYPQDIRRKDGKDD